MFSLNNLFKGRGRKMVATLELSNSSINQLSAFMASIDNPALILDHAGQLVRANQAYTQLPEWCRVYLESAPEALWSNKVPRGLACQFELSSLKVKDRCLVVVKPASQESVSPESVLKNIIHNTVNSPDIFHASVKTLGLKLGWRYAAVTRFVSEQAVDVLAFWDTTEWVSAEGYKLADKPCAVVAKQQSFTAFSDVQRKFPDDDTLKKLNVHSYAGLVYRDADNQPIGHVMLMHDYPVANLAAAEHALCMTSLALSSHFELIHTTENLKLVESKAKTDPLTLVGNRLALNDYLPTLDRSNQHAYLAMAADLDGLKQLNDQYGHDRGDEFLRLFGQELQLLGREGDRVFRTGGDEFLVIFEYSVALPVSIVRQRVFQAISRIKRKLKADVDCSVGFARLAESQGNVQAWLKLADSQMYLDKQSKRKK